jgi:hypothetical protein
MNAKTASTDHSKKPTPTTGRHQMASAPPATRGRASAPTNRKRRVHVAPAPVLAQTLTAVDEAIGDPKSSEPFNPATERDALAVTIGAPRDYQRTITAQIVDWDEEAPGQVPETYITIEIDGEPSVCNPEQARTSATRLHQLANHLQELAEKVELPEKKRPYWQTEPCPAWCTWTHRDNDNDTDRNHCSTGTSDEFPLSLHDSVYVPAVPASKTAHGREIEAFSYPHNIELSVQQGYRESEAMIDMFVPKAVAGDVHLTPAEARHLIASLTRLVDMVDPQQSGATE